MLEAELVVLGVRRTPADSRSDFTTLLVLLLLAEHTWLEWCSLDYTLLINGGDNCLKATGVSL